jgi:hypothetical protein
MHRPTYILIDQENFAVHFSNRRRGGGFCIPTELGVASRPLSPLEHAVYHEVLYRGVYAEDQRHRIYARYKLVQPEPWMIALAYIIWEGLVQGLAWDAVKYSLAKAIDALRRRKLAPPKHAQTHPLVERAETSRTEIGFFWEEYANDGRKLRHMFVGLRRVYQRATIEQRQAISNSSVGEQSKSNLLPRKAKKRAAKRKRTKGK